MTTQFIFIFLLILGLFFFVVYFYIFGLVYIKYKTDKIMRNRLSWLAMLMVVCGMNSLFIGSLIHNPLILKALPVTILVSIIFGLVFRANIVEPYRLGEFWTFVYKLKKRK